MACPNCRTTQPDYTFEPVTGAGTLQTWTVVHHSYLSGFPVPFVLVDVKLDDQPHIRLIGRLLHDPASSLQLGERMVVVFEDIGENIALPAFQKAAA